MNARPASLIALVLSLWVSGPDLARAEKIIFAYPSPSTSFLPLVVAQKRGFFEAENLQPELVQIRPAGAIPRPSPGGGDFNTLLRRPRAERMRGNSQILIRGVFDKPREFFVGSKGVPA